MLWFLTYSEESGEVKVLVFWISNYQIIWTMKLYLCGVKIPSTVFYIIIKKLREKGNFSRIRCNFWQNLLQNWNSRTNNRRNRLPKVNIIFYTWCHFDYLWAIYCHKIFSIFLKCRLKIIHLEGKVENLI